MNKHILTLLLPLICIEALPQQLSEHEKDNIRVNVRRMLNDSALTVATKIIGASSFYETVTGKERQDQIKSIYVAIQMLEVIEHDNLQNERYFHCYAFAQKLLHNYEKCIMSYSKAININPKNIQNYIDRGKCKIEIGDYYGAVPDITKGIMMSPKDDLLFGDRALCYLMTKQVQQALIDANQAIQLNDKVGSYFITRGVARIELNRKKDGCLDLSRATDLGDERAFELIRELCSD